MQSECPDADCAEGFRLTLGATVPARGLSPVLRPRSHAETLGLRAALRELARSRSKPSRSHDPTTHGQRLEINGAWSEHLLDESAWIPGLLPLRGRTGQPRSR